MLFVGSGLYSRYQSIGRDRVRLQLLDAFKPVCRKVTSMGKIDLSRGVGFFGMRFTILVCIKYMKDSR